MTSSEGHQDQGSGIRGRKRVVAREVESEPLDSNGHSPAETESGLPLLEGEIVLENDDRQAIQHQRDREEPPEQAYLPDEEAPRSLGPVAPLPESMPVVDPTLLGSRRRRSSHQRLYRWTQILSFLTAGLAAAAVICTMFDEPLVGRWLAGGALLPGISSWIVSGRSDLSRRWRGWAIASLVFAAVALGMTWVHETVVESESPDLAPIRAKKSAPAN